MSRASRVEDYIGWLGLQIRDDDGHQKYWDLIRLMFDKQFEWFVDHDDNRCQDGKDLRAEFCHDRRLRLDYMDFLGEHARFIEVLIGLSRRMSFLAGQPAPGWAWVLLQNIELHRMTDPLTPRKQTRAIEIMDSVISRKYRPDGGGGFFPLIDADEDDQTQVELWYQMSAYIAENRPGY